MALVTPTQLDSTHLLDRTGAKITLETLVHDHRAYLFRLCLSILNDENEAEDLTQETFVAALLGLNKFRGDAHIRTWLSSIAINLCRDFMRKRKARQTLQTALENLHLLQRPPLPEETYLQTERHTQLWEAVNQLDEKHRLPVILRYAHNLPTAEIAQILGLTEGTVHSRLHYARKQLLGDLKTHHAPRKTHPAGGLP